MREGFVASVLFGALAAAPAHGQGDGRKDLPSEFRQLVPRGRIAAIDSPRFVGAREARIPADAWVLGLVIGGEARAYSLNLLNRHEVVNDRVGGRSIAAVW